MRDFNSVARFGLEIRYFNSVARFGLEIENCDSIPSQGSRDGAVPGSGRPASLERAGGGGRALCGVVRSGYEVGPNACKTRGAPCRQSAAEAAHGGVPDGQVARKRGRFSCGSCTASGRHRGTDTLPLQPPPAVYLNWCKSQCEVSPKPLVSLGP